MDPRVSLESLSRRISRLKEERSQNSGILSALIQQQTDLHEKCRNLGVEPDELASVILEKEQQLEGLLTTLESEVSDVEQKRDNVDKRIAVT